MTRIGSRSRLSEFFGIKYPILSAPMAFAAGGALSAEVTRAGGLGLIGGGYGDADWVNEQFALAGNEQVGCGFITWHLAEAMKTSPNLLENVLEKKPRAIVLSFGDPTPYAEKISQYKVPLICQIQTVKDAHRAIDSGAQVLVAQGSEAGGHGQSRATMTLVPEISDLIANKSPQTLLCAAGGIADGRGLAAALMLGADGVMMGSRFWASKEAIVHANMTQAALNATGDDTIRSSVMDIARHLNWPKRYTARVLKNAFTDRWDQDIDGLLKNADEQAHLWREAWLAGDVNTANTFVGEAAGLINQISSVSEIIEKTMSEAEERLQLYR